jgi:UDP-glucose 4-epimerase
LDAIEFVRGDVRDYGVVESAVRGVDAVVHLAALIDVAESVEKPDLYFDVNVRGTYNVVKASKKRGYVRVRIIKCHLWRAHKSTNT